MDEYTEKIRKKRNRHVAIERLQTRLAKARENGATSIACPLCKKRRGLGEFTPRARFCRECARNYRLANVGKATTCRICADPCFVRINGEHTCRACSSAINRSRIVAKHADRVSRGLERICRDCLETKPYADYSPSSNRCKPCMVDYIGEMQHLQRMREVHEPRMYVAVCREMNMFKVGVSTRIPAAVRDLRRRFPTTIVDIVDQWDAEAGDKWPITYALVPLKINGHWHLLDTDDETWDEILQRAKTAKSVRQVQRIKQVLKEGVTS